MLALLLSASVLQGQSKKWSIGISLPLPSEINNYEGTRSIYEAGSAFSTGSISEEYTFTFLDVGLNLMYNGFFVNLYKTYRLGPASRNEWVYWTPPQTYAYRTRITSQGLYYFNLGYQYRFKNQADPEAVIPVFSVAYGWNNLEIGSGMEFKYGSLLLYAQFVSQHWIMRETPVFRGQTTFQGGIRTQIKLF